MPVRIKRRDPEPDIETDEPPSEGVHLRASLAELKIAKVRPRSANGPVASPLCGTDDPSPVETAISSRVSCPRCLYRMEHRLGYGARCEPEDRPKTPVKPTTTSPIKDPDRHDPETF